MNLSTTEIYTFLPILTVMGLWIAWNDLKTMLITNKIFGDSGDFRGRGPLCHAV